MKTILNLKQYVILLVAAFAMTSCLDSDDPDFQFIGGGGYIIQVTPTTFFPMIAAYANEPMTNGCKISNGKTNVSLTDIEGYQKMGVQTDPNVHKCLQQN